MSGVFIQILMTRTLDLFTTGSNLKRWRDNLLRSQVAQATTQTPSRAKMRPLPKFETCGIFANFVPRQKLEIF